MTDIAKTDSIVVSLRKGYEKKTIQEVSQDLLENPSIASRFKLQIKGASLYQGSHFVSSLFAEMLVISNKFEELQEAVLQLPYFEIVRVAR